MQENSVLNHKLINVHFFFYEINADLIWMITNNLHFKMEVANMPKHLCQTF